MVKVGHDEEWLLPDRIIDSGYKSHDDKETGLVYTDIDLAQFRQTVLRLNNEEDLGINPDLFFTVPFVYRDDAEKALVLERVIKPHMSDPDRLTIQAMMMRAQEQAKRRYEEVLSYVPEANRVKE